MQTIDWLLESDPAIRWQALRDLTDTDEDVVAAERALVATEGWGAQLLGLQDDNGHWDGGTYRPGWVDRSKPFFDAWTATHYSLQLLYLLGPDPSSALVRDAISAVRDNVKWEANGAPYFEGETEECINGIALSIGAYFGQPMDGVVERLVADQMKDGGWNCRSQDGATVGSLHSTICVLEGLLGWEKANGSSSEVASARHSGEEYLLERQLLRRRTTGDLIDPRFTMLSFPYYWYHDVLRALDYFRASGATIDTRCSEAVELVAGKRDPSGRWTLENRHQGATHFRVDPAEGAPSRWNTLRALRVLRWAGF